MMQTYPIKPVDHHAGIDYRWRPSNYFWAQEKGIMLPSDIKGASRRGVYQDALLAGHAADLEPQFLKHALTHEERKGLSGLHPWLMGGEYLPDRRDKEVEIASINIASTTQDVTSIYARRRGGRIHYRVVDEYEGMTLNDKKTRTSLQPLTLKQLLDFFMGAWNLLEVLEMNFSDHGYPRDEVHGFILGASSSFYSQFGEAISARVDTWLDEVSPKEGEEED